MRTILICCITVLAGMSASVMAGDVHEISLTGKRYVPYSLVVKDGDSIRICNNDTFFHSPFSMSRGNAFGNEPQIQLKPGECTVQQVRNDTQGCLPFHLFDNIHSMEKMVMMVPPRGRGEATCFAGSWNVVQTAGNGAQYIGTVTLSASGSNTVTGRAVWSNHSGGTVTGTVTGFKIQFAIDYGNGLVGTYNGTMTDKMDTIADGTAFSNKGGPGVSWTATK